jgi:hypothetical protein
VVAVGPCPTPGDVGARGSFLSTAVDQGGEPLPHRGVQLLGPWAQGARQGVRRGSEVGDAQPDGRQGAQERIAGWSRLRTALVDRSDGVCDGVPQGLFEELLPVAKCA